MTDVKKLFSIDPSARNTGLQHGVPQASAHRRICDEANEIRLLDLAQELLVQPALASWLFDECSRRMQR
jgi:hypothetical protein